MNKQYPDTVPEPNIIIDIKNKHHPTNIKIPANINRQIPKQSIIIDIINKQYPDKVPNPRIIKDINNKQ